MTNLRIEAARSNDLRISVIDEVSHTTIVRFTLSPEQVYAMVGGAYFEAEGEITDLWSRVGKTMVVDSVMYDRKDLPGSTYEQLVDDAEQAARADRPGWETYEARRTNTGGVRVILRRWE